MARGPASTSATAARGTERARHLGFRAASDMPRIAKTPARKKAANTDRWTEILFRALMSRIAQRWRFASFRGTGGGEWPGTVDVFGIRKNTSKSAHDVLKSGDLLEIILVQMKGGGARMPSPGEIQRLRAVAKRYGAKAIVLFAWKRE
jgi:hypothetical protein